MVKKKAKNLKFYMDCMSNKGMMMRDIGNISISVGGLCEAAQHGLIDREIFHEYFYPTSQEIHRLDLEGYSITFWASGEHYPNVGHLTPLRQTIVLFMAAMKGEL